MAKFIYRLQNVLDVKYKMENQAKTQFAIAGLKVREEEEKYEALIAKRQEYEAQYRDVLNNGIDIPYINLLRNGIEKIRSDMKNQLVNIKVANKNLDVARMKLDDAIKDRKIHEKLKENAFEQFKMELNEQEKKEIDELVSFTYGTNSKTGGEQ